MGDIRDLLLNTAERLLSDHCNRELLLHAEQGVWPQRLWRALTDAGLTAALLPEAAGGVDLAMADALSLLRPAARFAAPVPLAETMMANWLAAGAGMAVPDGILTVAPVNRSDRIAAQRRGDQWYIGGRASRIPWARHADAVIVLADGAEGAVVAAVPRSSLAAVAESTNIAGEPRDDIVVDTTLPGSAAAIAAIGRDELFGLGAAMRSVQIAGALAHVLDITVTYAGERIQFGRPIGKFQAVQQNLAVLAGQAAAAGAAADMAIDAAADGIRLFAIGAAKARTGEAASIGAGIAHQVHGAIGFTQEHMLHFSTRRLWSWRDEFGNEAEWQRRVGAQVAAAGAASLWRLITAA